MLIIKWNKRCQPEKATSYMIPPIWHSEYKTMETVKRSGVGGERDEYADHREFLTQ